MHGGAGGSGFIVLARYAMDGLGLDINKDFGRWTMVVKEANIKVE